MKPEFKEYQKQIRANAKALGEAMTEHGFRLVSGGTENHVMLADLRPKSMTGKVAEKALDKAGITVNKNKIPYDPEKPLVTSGIRLGTPAVTTRGMKEPQMAEIAALINDALSAPDDDVHLAGVKERVKQLTSGFPLYPELMKDITPL